jgi:hypothetical protein
MNVVEGEVGKEREKQREMLEGFSDTMQASHLPLHLPLQLPLQLRLHSCGYIVTVTQLRLPSYGYPATVTQLRLPMEMLEGFGYTIHPGVRGALAPPGGSAQARVQRARQGECGECGKEAPLAQRSRDSCRARGGAGARRLQRNEGGEG